MFKKSGSSKDVIVVTENKFSVGNKICLGGVNWTIMEAFDADNTEMRKITNVAGDEEIMTLATLIKDAESE
jgi:hypothetical protein